MAKDENKALPKITTKNWWGIRKKLKATMPKTITKSFVAAAMDIQESTAQKNVIVSMIIMGLIEEDGSPTGLANEWRDDAKYSDACEKIRHAVYPQELRDLAPNIEADKSIIKSWIASHLTVGDEAARQSAAVYVLLLEKDPEKQNDAGKTITRKKVNKPNIKQVKNVTKKTPALPKDPLIRENKVKTNFDHTMNINIQIHISSDTNADQIDKIFSSMAKHLKSLNEE